MITAHDLGSYNIKNDMKKIFTSRFEEWDGNNTIGEELLEYDGITYAMGKGLFDNEFDKTEKNYMPNLLLSLDKYMKNKTKLEDIDLVLGLPLSHLGRSDKIKSELANQEFTYKLNGVEKSVSINRVAVVGESIGAYYTIEEEERKNSDILFFDIGGKTTNIIIFKKGKLISKDTIPLGTIDLFRNFANYYNNENGDKKIPEDIGELITKKIIVDDDEIIRLKENFFKSIINGLKGLKIDQRLYVNYFSGGGSLVIKKQIEELNNQYETKFIENPIFANVLGNKLLAEAMWGEDLDE